MWLNHKFLYQVADLLDDQVGLFVCQYQRRQQANYAFRRYIN